MDNKSMEQNILDTAEKLFLKKGFALTSTTEIAKEVGCNQALVHYYFRTKDKLFESIFQKKLMVFFSSFIQISEEDIPLEEKLKRKIESHFDMLYKNQQLPFLFMNELVTNPSRILTIKEGFATNPFLMYGKFLGELEEEIRLEKIRDISAIDLVLTVFSLNITVFLLKPVMKEMLGMSDSDFNNFVLKRKEENVITILNSLKSPN